jgi:hypothetical protein
MPHFKRKRRRQQRGVIGKQKQLYRTADRMNERRQWQRDERDHA